MSRHGKYDGSFMRGMNSIWDFITIGFALFLFICAIILIFD